MSMEVVGLRPASEAGKYYHRAGVTWCALADFILAKADRRITKRCKHWQSNDGDGLDGVYAQKLASELERMLDDGAVAAYIQERKAALASLPDETCELCFGTGVRRDEIGVESGQPEMVIDERTLDVGPFCQEPEKHPRFGQKGFCNGCWGVGSNEPFETSDLFEEEDAREFVAFLKDCGGFKIF